jgi:hypothetical protein
MDPAGWAHCIKSKQDPTGPKKFKLVLTEMSKIVRQTYIAWDMLNLRCLLDIQVKMSTQKLDTGTRIHGKVIVQDTNFICINFM